MNLLSDILTYIRRIIKSPSNAQITDDLLIDYVNRFWTMDVDARMQLFDLKTKYQFLTTPGVDKYNMPLYNLQKDDTISYYPVYQGFMGPVYVNGVLVSFTTQKTSFFNLYPNVMQTPMIVGTGDGTAGPYNLQLSILPGVNSTPLNPPIQGILRGHIDIAGVIASSSLTGSNQDPPLISAAQISTLVPFIEDVPVTSVESAVYITATAADGTNIVVADSGQFLDGEANYGLLMEPGKAPYGNLPLSGAPVNYSNAINTINYLTGEINVTFPAIIPDGANISAQCYWFQTGLPRSVLYYNNVLYLRSPPDQAYLVELDAYLSPAAYLATGDAIQYAYMSEYIARGAARKILSDTGDIEQFQFYEPLFKEQELLVWKRSQRQFTATRSQTIYSTPGSLSGNFNQSYTGF